MKLFIQNGKVIDFANSTGSTILSGAGVVVGSLFGVATGDILDGDTGGVVLEGVVELPVKGGVTPTQGQVLYWSTSTKNLTATDSDVPAGTAFELVTGNATCRIKLFENAPSAASVATDVAALAGTLTGTVTGTIANVAGTAAGTAGGSTPTAAQVDTGVAAAIAPLVVSTNLALKEIQTVLNATLAALKAANLMA